MNVNEEKNRGAADPARRGFTLLELLMVIGVIAVLAGLLLPVLSKAKASARNVECKNRLRQWPIAFVEYADDNGSIPREGFHRSGRVYWNNWSQVSDPQSEDVWYNTLAKDYLSRLPASHYGLPTSDQGAFYDRPSFFHCPAARFEKTSGPIAFFSLAMNSHLIEPGHAPTISFSRIRDTSRTVLFLDNLLESDRKVVEEQAWIYLGQPAASAARFAGNRHGGMGNLSFADGHVASFPGDQVVETRGRNRGWEIQPPRDIRWDPYD